MKHIRQINSVGTNTYTVVKTEDWTLPLEEHPSVVEHPELFEISEDEIPVEHQYLIYESA
jgi:hypothetical protein